MPLRFTDRIVDHLTHRTYRPAPPEDIARDLGVPREARDAFMTAVEDLVEAGRIELAADGRVRLPKMEDEIEGKLRIHARGFGFVIPDQPRREGDLFIPAGATSDALSGDRVRAQISRTGGRGRFGKREAVGRVVEVLERGQSIFTGTLVAGDREWSVVPDGRRLHEPVIIRDPHAKNAKAGDKVVFQFTLYPDERALGEGVIVRVLGEAGRPDVETAAVIEAFGLRDEYPEEGIAEAGASVERFEALLEDEDDPREDLTDQLIFTIDPPDAKDFDDAISIERDADSGEWILGIHIADVATFVPPGGPLDTEAKLRGNSVYLPRHVIPMLPEVLSNGVCSLQEGVLRLTKSVFITYDAEGRVLSQRLAATKIKSRRRLTYLEAQAIIDGDEKEARKHARTKPVYDDDLVAALRASNTLARLIRKQRFKDGMIVLDLPEVELEFDDAGHVVDAHPEDDAYTHTIIEMFMVAANEAVARTFDALEVPLLRRIHPDPTFGAIEELRLYARAAKIELPEQPSRRDLQKLLKATHDSPSARALHFAVLRTLSKASYSPALVGHFALASDHYAHFTSPIRRYPDLTVHRVFQAYLDHTDNGRKVPGGRKREGLGARIREDTRVFNEAELITIGRQCSDTEVAAAEAERELRSFLVLQFLAANHLGDEFDGVVTGVSRGGAFVSINRFLVEGLCKVEEFPGRMGKVDRWNLDQEIGRLVAQRSGASIGLGDIVKVQVTAVDVASRHLDLLLVAMPEPNAAMRRAVAVGSTRKRGKGKGSNQKGKRGKDKGKRR